MSDTSTAGGPATAEAPWPVSELAAKLKGYIDRLGTVWIEGELTQWNVRAGHVYAKLRDLEQDVTVDLRVWASTRAKFDSDFAQGDRVVALVKPDYWVKGGMLSMQAYQMRHVGLGDLLERLEKLRHQLAEEGLFAPERKKPLPFLPGCIGLVTGKDSDAEKDVLRNAQLRWPQVQFRVRHAAVQGDRAAADVTAGIRELDADPEVDVIIVARGGGDFQNLLPFSDEQLLRTVAAAQTPVVSAIGHEADRPLLDEVADLRASTPTDAAKRVVPDVAEELALMQQARARMALRLSGLVSGEVDRIAQLRSRPVLASPEVIIDSRADELVRWASRGSELVGHRVERAGLQIGELTGRLRTLSPQSTLARGYAIAQDAEGRILRGVTGTAAPGSGDAVSVTLADGALDATVTAVRPGALPTPPTGGGAAAGTGEEASSGAAE